MKKQQVLKFWKAIDNSTGYKEVISDYNYKKGYGGKRTLKRYIQAMEGFKEGLSFEIICQKTGWSMKYITKIHIWWVEYQKLDLPPSGNLKLKDTSSSPLLIKHLDELAYTAEIIAHQIERLLRYKDNPNIQAEGDILGHLTFWRGQMIIHDSLDPVGEFVYESEHPINSYLAKLLGVHYKNTFGKLPVKEWNKLSIQSVNNKLLENLQFLAHGGLTKCTDCPICKEIASQ